MNNQILQVKFTERLNKLSSADYGNVECWMIAEAFNKALDAWVLRQLEGINQTKSTAEGSIRSIDKLERILTDLPLTMVNKGIYWESPLPANYLEWSRVSTNIQKQGDCCEARRAKVFLGEEADIDVALLDRNKKPSYDFAETFGTVIGGKVRIYTNGCFDIVSPVLTFYKAPKHIQIANCTDPDTGDPVTIDVECELPDAFIELIIDEGAAILAGDMDNTAKQNALNQSAEFSN